MLFSPRNSGGGGWGVETQSVCECTNLKRRLIFQTGSYIVSADGYTGWFCSVIYVNGSLISGFTCWNPAALVILRMKEVRSGQSNGTKQKADFTW